MLVAVLVLAPTPALAGTSVRAGTSVPAGSTVPAGTTVPAGSTAPAGAAAQAGTSLSVGTFTTAAPDLAFTVVSTSPVYAPVDGASEVFAELRNDDPNTTLSVGRAFAVTFYDGSGAVVGVVTGSAAPGSPASLATGLRAVPPGQIGDVSATLPGVVAASARVTNASASGSPYSDARLPTTTAATRTQPSATTDNLAVTAVNTTGYPSRLHVVVAAEAATGALLGIVAAAPGDPLPSGTSETVSVDYQRLPTEPVADHYDVFIEGQADGAAASSLVTPTADDTPVSGLPTTLRTQLLDGKGHAIAGQQVLLTSRLPGRTPTVLSRARTGPDGRVALTLILPKTGVLQVAFNGDPTHAPAGTGDFSFRLTPRLSLGAAVAGTTALVRGALPDYPGEKVTVQERIRNVWRTLRTVKTDGRGGFRFLLHPTAGHHSYRAAVPATSTHLAVTSSPVTISVGG